MLEGKTILVTGSSRGIGAATARLAKEYGAEVILHGRTESQSLKKIANEIGSRYIFCDASDEEAVKIEVEKIRNIEILVNNAGVNFSKPFMEATKEHWTNTFNANLYGTINFSKAILPRMKENKYGKIINISSVKGFSNISGSPAYSASKAAIINLTSSMAKEFAPDILINCVAPGFTETEMVEKTMSKRIKEEINQIPLRRIAKPEEIAEIILFLASDKSNYITGQTFVVDGGYSIRK